MPDLNRVVHKSWLAAVLALSLAVPSMAWARAPETGSPLDGEIEAVSGAVTAAYRFLHENPELGKEEVKAHDYLSEQLRSFGLTEFVTVKSLPTAVIAVLDSGKPGPVIALRAEMDAKKLGIGRNEPPSHDPRSQIAERMHNCGHDAHAAILLGTAKLLTKNKESLAGKVVFLFQPAEETVGGADDIVDERILEQLGVSAIFAQHAASNLPVGTVAISQGYILAGSSTFKIKLTGKGSHAAVPFEGDDLPLVASRVALALSTLPARRIEFANRPVVISVTRLVADGQASNVIPAEVELSGTVRAFEEIESGSPSIKALITQVLDEETKPSDITASLEIKPGAPPTLNNNALFGKVTKALGTAWPSTLILTPSRGMFAEDFAYYTRATPSLYFSMGIAKDGAGLAGVHTEAFQIHPDAFPYGVRLMVLLALINTTGDATWPVGDP